MEFYTNLLTSGDDIVYIGYRNGKRIKERLPFSVEIFTESKESTPFISQNGKYLDKQVHTIQEHYKYVKDWKQQMNLYGDVAPIYQFINAKWGKEKHFYDISQVKFVSLDIEVLSQNGFPNVNKADQVISCISIKDFQTKNVYVLSLRNFDVSKMESEVSKDKIQFQKMNHEIELLETFVFIMNKISPDVITGWNIGYFDIPYLSNRIVKIVGEKTLNKLSPTGRCSKTTIKTSSFQEIEYYDFLIPILDYLPIYKKFTYKTRESYSLDNICKVEIQKQKVKTDMSLEELWEKDPQKYIEYNIWDTELVYLLNEKLKLMELATTIAYETKTLFKDVYSPVKLWDILIYNALKLKKIEVPPNRHDVEKIPYPGAYVRDPKIGLNKWIISYDLNSLYPNIIIGCNLSKETMVKDTNEFQTIIKSENDVIYTWMVENILKHDDEFIKYYNKLKKYNYCYTPNGCLWKRDKQGTIGEIMEEKYNERIEVRKQIKTLMKGGKKKSAVKDLDLKQQALKVLLNSGYGAFANEYFRYYDIKIASAITITGQLVIQWVSNWLDDKLGKYVEAVYNDTDSTFLSCDKLIQSIQKEGKTTKDYIYAIDKFSKTIIEPEIKKSLADLADKLNMFKNTLEMKREVIGDVAIWVAKKKYAIRKWMDENEEFEIPELKTSGIEMVKTSTPEVIRTKLKEILNILLDNDKDKILQVVKDYKLEFNKQPAEKIAFPRSISDIDKYHDVKIVYKKGTPIHVRGALLYNKKIKELNLLSKYKPIYSGDKIKFIYLKTPNNMYNENIVAFLDELPKEFKLEKFIDYDLQFDKTFIAPVNILTKPCGLDVAKKLYDNAIDISDLFH
jgi:DNA polymerase elongation subunit (family B)